MIWSVSMSSNGSTTVLERIVRIGSISNLLGSAEQLARVRDGAFHRGRRGGDRAREDRARAGALPALEVAVARADRKLARRHDVAVHADAHRAARLAPFAARRADDLVEPFRLGVALRLIRARHDEQAHAVRDFPSLENTGRLANVSEPAVRARADEHDVD